MKNTFTSLSVVILAAGESQRMGKPKGLLNYRGKTFFTHQIESLRRIGFSDIITVLGSDHELYKNQVPSLKHTVMVINEQPEDGPFSSIQCGLKKTSGSKVYILPIDVPCPDLNVWKKLDDDLIKSDSEVSIPLYQNKKGHPVLLSNKFKQYLLTCSSQSRLDYEIKKQKSVVSFVNDYRITLNLNTPQEWETFIQGEKRNEK